MIKLLTNMNSQNLRTLFLAVFYCFISSIIFSQDVKNTSIDTTIFGSTEILPVRFEYSRKKVKKETNDSTYIYSQLAYKDVNETWQNLDIKLRARGNFRRRTCYFTPLKLKIKKSNAKTTIFKGHKRLKVVLPCLNESEKNDKVIKEYLIYKMLEVMNQNHFKTRLIDIEYTELRNRKTKTYHLKGFFIEDADKAAKRLKGKIIKRKFSPQGFDDLASVRNAMFQFMIGNTDYSASYSHNCKVMFRDKKFVPVSYDFDMSGFVNTSYSVVSQINNKQLPIDDVTQRYYRGYQRDRQHFTDVREEFLNKKDAIFEAIDSHKEFFTNRKNFEGARQYIEDFFKLLANESEYYKKTFHKGMKL